MVSVAHAGIIQEEGNVDLAANVYANPDGNVEYNANTNAEGNAANYQDASNTAGNVNLAENNPSAQEGNPGENQANPEGKPAQQGKKPPLPGKSPVDPNSKVRPNPSQLKFKAKKINLVFEKAKKVRCFSNSVV